MMVCPLSISSSELFEAKRGGGEPWVLQVEISNVPCLTLKWLMRKFLGSAAANVEGVAVDTFCALDVGVYAIAALECRIEL